MFIQFVFAAKHHWIKWASQHSIAGSGKCAGHHPGTRLDIANLVFALRPVSVNIAHTPGSGFESDYDTSHCELV
jgi:hypothetical protein